MDSEAIHEIYEAIVDAYWIERIPIETIAHTLHLKPSAVEKIVKA